MNKPTVRMKPVPATVALSLATALTVLLWIDEQTLLWITEETLLLRGVVASLTLWLLIMGHAHNRAKVRWLREEMRSIWEHGATPRAARPASGVYVRYAPAWCVLVLALGVAVAYRLESTALLWLTHVPDVVVGCVASGLVWLSALAVAGGSRRVRQLTIKYRGFKDSEELSLEMMESVPVMISVSLPDGTRTRFNRHYLELTGKTEEDLIGKAWLESVHEDDREQLEALFGKPSGDAVKIEYGMTGPDGQNRWIREHIVPRFTPSGAVRNYIVTGIDITAQTENDTEHEQTIRRQHEQVSELERKLAEQRKAFDEQRKAFDEQHRQEIDALESTHAEDLDSLRARHGEETDNLKRRKREDVDTLKAQHRAEAKDLKKQVETLTRSRERFEARFQEARESAQDAREQLGVLRNDIAQAQGDLKSAQAEQQQFKLENRQLNESVDKLQGVVEKMVAGDEERRHEQEESEKHIESARAAAAEARQTESQLRAKMNRLTVRVQRLEEELTTAQTDRTEQEESAKTQADARNRDLAQELWPQLKAVLDVSERLQDTALDETQVAALEGAQASAAAMARLVERALGAEGDHPGTVTTGEPAAARTFDLRAAVTSTCELIKSAEVERAIDIRCVIHPDFPTRVNADPVSVREVLIHLLRRAAAVVDEGTISVVLSDCGRTMTHVAARFEIKHDAARFDAEELGELFAVRTPSADIDSGTDVGRYRAAVAWELIASMNGDFDVNVRPKGGFVIGFTLSLPKLELAAPEPPPVLEPPSSPAAPSALPPASTAAGSASSATAQIESPAAAAGMAASPDPIARARCETPRMPQEDLSSNLGEVLELGQDNVKIRCARMPRNPVTIELDDADERLTVSAEILSTENAGRRGHDVVFRFVDVTPLLRQRVFNLALAHRKR